MSAIPMSGMVEHYDRRRAMRYLDQNDVVFLQPALGIHFLLRIQRLSESD